VQKLPETDQQVIGEVWESFTWAMSQGIAWVWDLITDAWRDHPTLVFGVVITIIVALVVTFRPAR
jgi:hypothetical protein